MPTIVTGSLNLTSLDSKIVADLCSGFFYVDVTPTVFLPGGTGTSGGVQGANVKITNPLGVVIKQYSTSGFDIYPPMTSRVSFAIPKTAGKYVYGSYVIDVQLTDVDGTQYVVSKTVNICPPDPNNKNKNEGCLKVDIRGNCKDGKVVFLLNQPPNYKGTMFTSQDIDMTLQYPTASGLPNREDIAHPSFSVALYEGEYKITGTTCVWYAFGDNIFYNIPYKINCSKIIKCLIDMCCVQAKWDELAARLDTDCTEEEKQITMGIIVESQFYVTAAQGAANCGADPSNFISKLELLLGCVCTCNCNEGAPIIDNTPARDFTISGCGVDKETVGLTDNYTINVYDYELVNDDTLGIISVGDILEDGCTKKQHINISIAKIISLLPSSGVDWVYKAVLDQVGGAAPQAQVDSRSTATVVWTRLGVGSYVGTVTGATFSEKTFFVLMGKTANVTVKCNYLTPNTFQLISASTTTDSPSDTYIQAMPFVLSVLKQ